MTPEERFWPKVDKTGDCWLWTGSITPNGYGQFSVNGRPAYAHRWAYAHHFGPIPKGMVIDHTCHNRGCVNPAHLRAATHKQNMENRCGSTVKSRSGVRGVTWDARCGRWRAYAVHHGKYVHVGAFATVAEAEAAVIAARLELFTHNDADRRGTGAAA